MKIKHCLLLPLLFYCQPPLEPPDTSSDYIEFESVWQYLKAYSIYQERIPADPFVYRSPADLLRAMNDTLGGSYYTDYRYDTLPIDNPAPAAAAFPATASLAPRPNSTVFLDTLTDSVALITIWTFDDDSVYYDLLSCASPAARFPNIVVNVRNNRGGYIDQADSVIAALIPAGTEYIESRHRDYDVSTDKFVTLEWDTFVTQYGPRSEFAGKRFAVLMNGYSASASEFVAAALYEGVNAPLIGQPSYGKGIGQVEIVRRRDMSVVGSFMFRRKLLITFMQLRGVSGRIGDYHGVGIQPDAVPQAVQDMASAASLTPWQSQLFYAVRTLDSAATPSSIDYPPERDTLGLSKSSAVSGLSKVIYEQ
ncbi:MAG: hypothetical protein JW699_06555 [Chitinispirillaceae bacterium]|nr:hypothetical protein [Chitinispirillaceae bacterium]